MRSGGPIRYLLIVIILFLGWYTFQLYAELYGRISVKTSEETKIEFVPDKKSENVKISDQDSLIDQKKIEEANRAWDKEQKDFKPNIQRGKSKDPCAMDETCKADEFSVKIVTGAANVIGPSICFNNTIIMKNSLNNVDRGMNIAVLNGKTGVPGKKVVFDLYGKDSTELKAFLAELKDDEVILVTTYDDAAFKLDDEAKATLGKLGSSKAKELEFRDNWIFVGGKNIKHPSVFEQIAKNVKETNKYGDWPEAITLTGCLPKLR